jgi:hypothetical protein
LAGTFAVAEAVNGQARGDFQSRGKSIHAGANLKGRRAIVTGSIA